jgi:protein O-mannosyl-transferase
MRKQRSGSGSNKRTLRLSDQRKSPVKTADTSIISISLRDAALGALLLCATLFAYWRTLRGGLLWDDDYHVTRPELQTVTGLWRIWFDLGATAQYYPLLHSAFWLEHRLWGDAVLGYHLVNITLHIISAFLVVLIVRRLALPGAWLAGFIFALHPICVEAVAWISEQKSTLSGAFYLAAALSYLHYDETRRKSAYLLATGMFVLALLSKTVTATLPAVLLVVLWWRWGRLNWRRDVFPLLPWFAAAVPMGLFTVAVEKTVIGAQGPEFALTIAQRVLLAGRTLWFYAMKVVWPANLTFNYPRWKLNSGVWWQYLFPVGAWACAVGFWFLARRYRAPLASLLIFGGSLFPVLGFLNVYPFRYSYVADHFQYLASLGIIVPLASGLAAGARAWPRMGAPNVLAALLVAGLGLLTWRQTGMYRDAETLYRETLARNPASWLAHNNLGSALVLIPDQLPAAIAEYEAALRIEPNYPEAHFNLGAALVRTQIPERAPEAIAEYEAALRIKPDYAEAHNNLGNALSHLPGRLPDAIMHYEAALRIKPDLARTHMNLGNALAQTPGRLSDAIAHYQAALRIEPDSAEAHFNLGNALTQIPGRRSEAIAEYQAALRLRADLEPARLMIEQLQATQ